MSTTICLILLFLGAISRAHLDKIPNFEKVYWSKKKKSADKLSNKTNNDSRKLKISIFTSDWSSDCIKKLSTSIRITNINAATNKMWFRIIVRLCQWTKFQNWRIELFLKHWPKIQNNTIAPKLPKNWQKKKIVLKNRKSSPKENKKAIKRSISSNQPL